MPYPPPSSQRKRKASFTLPHLPPHHHHLSLSTLPTHTPPPHSPTPLIPHTIYFTSPLTKSRTIYRSPRARLYYYLLSPSSRETKGSAIAPSLSLYVSTCHRETPTKANKNIHSCRGSLEGSCLPPPSQRLRYVSMMAVKVSQPALDARSPKSQTRRGKGNAADVMMVIEYTREKRDGEQWDAKTQELAREERTAQKEGGR